MDWRLRATALRMLASVPAGRWLYQRLQQHLGLHRRPVFLRTQLEWQARLARELTRQGARLEGARIVEIGTGWVPIVPIGFWLCGAAQIDTYDLNRWLLPKALGAALDWLVASRAELSPLWAPFTPADVLEARLDLLAQLAREPLRFLDAARIIYHAPADARATGLDARSVDLHYSVQVLEHVAPHVIPDLLAEALRILKPGGWSAHQIDPSDHFSHFDPKITAIHFLRFEPARWQRIAGNVLAYHNRLRVHEHLRCFENSGLELVETSACADECALAALAAGHDLAEPFRSMQPEEVCRRSLWVFARKPLAA